jgi:acetolactate synthase-1/2/3 large subunit
VEITGHGGNLALPVLRAHGVREMFTLSGGHVFPLYDGAVHADPPMPLYDVRHEQSAAFAAEAVARLNRRPGVAVLTAGPGITNGISAITTAHFNGSPVLVLGGRAPAGLWGAGSLQELDHPQLVAAVTKLAVTAPTTADVPAYIDRALTVATTAHRGPTFVDVPMDELFGDAKVELPPAPQRTLIAPDPGDLGRVAQLLRTSVRPLLMLGSDVWADGAEEAARTFAETFGIPVITNGQARGILPAGHPLLVTKARGQAFGGADLVLVAGTPLDFRIGFGRFGGPDQESPTPVIHLVDAPSRLGGGLVDPAATAAGDLTSVFSGIASALSAPPAWTDWVTYLQGAVAARNAKDADLLATDTPDIHPARVLGELIPRLDADAVVIGDGGDFVSYAGRLVEPRRPGCWLDPGPYGCLGTGLGYAMGARVARPDAQIVTLLGDGAAGFSLMDVDSLVRNKLPMVMVVGNNGMWALEKYPMQAMYGYDVVADLTPQCRYDEVVKALGGAGEMVTRPGEVGPALDRAFASGVPYLVNVVTDASVSYPRTTILA